MTGLVFGWAMALATSASAQSFLDRFGTPVPAPSKVPPKKPDPKPSAPEPVTDDPVAAPTTVDDGAADDPGPIEPSATPEAADLTTDGADGEVDALVDPAARLDRGPAALPEGVEGSDGPTVTAGLRAATAYAVRGSNVFGRNQGSAAGLAQPSLEVDAGGWAIGWIGDFQAYGAHRRQLVQDAVGGEQDGFVDYTVALNDWLALDGGLWAIAYPFAEPQDGSGLPLVVEPGVSVTAEVGVELTAGVLQSQGVGPGTNAASYTYAQLGIDRSIDLTDHATIELAATTGAKRWDTTPRARPNTWDVDLSGGLALTSGRVSVRPTAHLTWTNLPGTSVGGEAFGWGGIETELGL